jgi:hypothetical protein
LTDSDIARIRFLYGKVSTSSLAKKFRVHRSTIRRWGDKFYAEKLKEYLKNYRLLHSRKYDEINKKYSRKSKYRKYQIFKPYREWVKLQTRNSRYYTSSKAKETKRRYAITLRKPNGWLVKCLSVKGVEKREIQPGHYHYFVRRICPVCGMEFEMRPNMANRIIKTVVTCSNKCKGIYWMREKRLKFKGKCGLCKIFSPELRYIQIRSKPAVRGSKKWKQKPIPVCPICRIKLKRQFRLMTKKRLNLT